jgi:hypothetical protein
MLLRNTEYAERYDVKLLLLLRRFHGSMHRPSRRLRPRFQWKIKAHTDDGRDIPAAADVDESREQRSEVTPRTDRVCGDVGPTYNGLSGDVVAARR